MNTPEKNNYIQYVNKNGIVKAKNVVFDKGEETTTFTVSGIDEEFFIFAIYENNIQRFCVGIENLENTDMLGFINSNMVDLSCIPEYAFLQPQTSVEFSYNNEYVENFRHGQQSGGVSTAITQQQHSDNIAYYMAFDADSNEILDPAGNNVLNVRLVKDPSQLIDYNLLNDPQALFLFNYCKEAYPLLDFEIKPFIHHLTENHPIVNIDFNKLFYAVLPFHTNRFFVVESLKNNASQEDCWTNLYTTFVLSNEPILFNRLNASTGSNYAGITGVTPANSYYIISGYVAIFPNNTFAGG